MSASPTPPCEEESVCCGGSLNYLVHMQTVGAGAGAVPDHSLIPTDCNKYSNKATSRLPPVYRRPQLGQLGQLGLSTCPGVVSQVAGSRQSGPFQWQGFVVLWFVVEKMHPWILHRHSLLYSIRPAFGNQPASVTCATMAEWSHRATIRHPDQSHRVPAYLSQRRLVWVDTWESILSV